MKPLINRIARVILKRRHAMAQADLRWLVERAPKCIQEQCARVTALESSLRARGGAPDPADSAEDIARRMERKLKLEGVLQ